MTEKLNIVFVCLGNICRSPLAEAVFQQIVVDKKQTKLFHIESSGTSNYHIGDSPDPRMQATAAKHGVPMDNAGSQFIKDDFEKFDLIIVMDSENYKDVTWLTQNAKFRKKVHLLRDFDPKVENTPPVPDPYYGGKEGFEEVFQIVHRSCLALYNRIISDTITK